MNRTMSGLLIGVMLTGVCWGSKNKYPYVWTPQANFAFKLDHKVNKKGINISVAHSGSCIGYKALSAYINDDKVDCLCVVNIGNSDFSIDQFMKDQIMPRLKKMKSLGFVEIDYVPSGFKPEYISFPLNSASAIPPASPLRSTIQASERRDTTDQQIDRANSAPEAPSAATNVDLPSSNNSMNTATDRLSPPSQPRDGNGFLGLTVASSPQGGVQIVKITQDGPAYFASLHVGDVINSVDGKRIRSVADFSAALSGRNAGSTVHIGYMFHSGLGWMQGAEKVIALDARSD
jgi:hypothetical protein